jgi:hypothetical protein
LFDKKFVIYDDYLFFLQHFDERLKAGRFLFQGMICGGIVVIFYVGFLQGKFGREI